MLTSEGFGASTMYTSSRLRVREELGIPPEYVPQFVETNNTGMYCAVILATVVIYDALCTMKMEAKHVWGQKLTAARIVYLINRYVGILGAIVNICAYSYNATYFQCEVFLWLPTVTYAITIVCIDYFLVLRVLALYQTERRVLFSAFLWSLLALEGIVKIGFSLPTVFISKVAVGVLADNVSICGSEVAPPAYLYLVHWSAPLVFGAFLMTLALTRAAEVWRTQGFQGSSLVCVLVLDQVFYFLLAISCSVLNILANRYTSSTIAINVLQALGSPSLQCILGSHMFFNLREVAEHTCAVSAWYSSYSMGNLQFAGGGSSTLVAQPHIEVAILDTKDSDLHFADVSLH